MTASQQQHLVVIGGGAAGFFTAIHAAEKNPQLKVTILEKTGKLLSKVKVSGGGRCNVTHACFDILEMAGHYPRGHHFVKKAFHHFFTTDTIQWFEAHGVLLKTEADGRMFPVTNSSETILRCLLDQVSRLNIQIQLHSEVTAIEPGTQGHLFDLQVRHQASLPADFVCVTCGGYHKASQFDWLKRLGHTIAEPLPSLFTFNMPADPITSLMGVSVEHAIVKIAGTRLVQQGPVLITHWGLSGPAVLKLSAWGAVELAQAGYQFTANINWLPAYNEQTLQKEWPLRRHELAGQKMSHRNPFGLPARLWQFFLQRRGITDTTRWADLNAARQQQLIQLLTAYPASVKGKTTFKEEFVTCGGINLGEVDVNSMQSKKVPGLYFAGEILNVDGVTGGFNFQHAWTSGWIAAQAIARAHPSR